MKQLVGEVGKEIKTLSEHRPKDGRGTFLNLELKNVQMGKVSEAKDILKGLRDIGRQAGVIVNVTVREGNKIKSPDGVVLRIVSLEVKRGGVDIHEPDSVTPRSTGHPPVERPKPITPGVPPGAGVPPRVVQPGGPRIPGYPH